MANSPGHLARHGGLLDPPPVKTERLGCGALLGTAQQQPDHIRAGQDADELAVPLDRYDFASLGGQSVQQDPDRQVVRHGAIGCG